MKTVKIWIWIVLATAGYIGCSDMNDLHDQYLQRGESIFVGQPDSVKIVAGKNRVKITCRNYDPKVAKLTVYWDFRQGSKSFDVPSDRLGEDMELIIDGLKEKQYTFELVTTNPVGQYPSIPASISGPVYGSRYEASLTNRKVGSATIFPSANNKTSISLTKALDKMVGVEVKYMNSSDKETILEMDNDDMELEITDSKDGVIEYRTLYVPENCIDTFYTNFTPINFTLIEDEKLDRLLFKRWNTVVPYTGYVGWDIENMWDGVIPSGTTAALSGEPGYLSNTAQNVSVAPWDFTFDLGQMVKLRRFIFYSRLNNQQYTVTHPKRIELYASPTPNVTANLDDWIFLGEFNSIKPSGLATGFTTEDTNHAMEGEEFFTTDDSVVVRYLRFRVMETWVTPTGNHTIAILQLVFFGVPEAYLDL